MGTTLVVPYIVCRMPDLPGRRTVECIGRQLPEGEPGLAWSCDCIRNAKMMDISIPVVAGAISTMIFAASALPMLLKAHQTKDLASYSRGNMLMANTGNVVHSAYVYSLPPGPIWLLHAFYLITMAIMLVWYLRYEWRPSLLRQRRASPYPDRIPQTGQGVVQPSYSSVVGTFS
jgi:uncharacterized protein with PQ loop repeat